MRGDLSPFKRDLMGADKQVKGMGDRLKGLLSPKNLVMGAAGGLLASEVFQFFDGAVNAAAEFQDTVAATGVILGGDLQPQMEAWAETASEAFGASKQDALAAANQMAVFGKSAGLAGDDLAGFAQEMTQLGGDLASMFGGSTQDAITAVGAALRGESEPIRRYGVLLDDATLRARAFEMGIIDSTKNALTPQQRVLAAHAEILAQTTDAQGDFARTSDGMANTQRALGAELENVTIEIGEKLLPVALELANFVKDVLIPTFSWFGENVLGNVFEGIGNLANSFKEAAGDVHFFAMNFGEQGDRVHGIADRFGEDFDDLKDRIRDRMLETGETFEEAADTIESEMERAKLEGSASAWELQQEISAAAVAGTASARTEAGNVADAIPAAVKEHWREIYQAGVDTLSAYRAGVDDPTERQSFLDEIDDFLEDLNTALEPGEYIAELHGRKMELAVARGIAVEKGDLGAVAAIDKMLDEIYAELNTLNGYDTGKNLVITLANGITENLGTASLASAALARVISGPTFIHSEPEDHSSPLYGITKIGGNIVDTIAEGIYGNLGTGYRAATALAGALVPSMAVPAFVGGDGMVGAGTGDTYILQVEGKDKVVDSFGDMWDGFQQLSGFSDRSMT